MKYHIIAFILGFLIDLILGDPYCLPHPIRLIGNLIGKLESTFLGTKDCPKNKQADKKKKEGRITVLLVVSLTCIVTSIILIGAYVINPFLGCAIEAVMTYQILATKCLKVESMKVYDKLKNGTIEEARFAVSMIVGRDTNSLDKNQIAKAAVETVAENTSDGVIAPMIYLALGGPILGFIYKAVNTMDSMIGYKNERYIDFGRMAAKLDDVVNYIPARFSAWLMIFACAILGRDYSYKNAKKIFKRDRYNHSSPNSAQTESVCAGALGIKLAGDASYFGKIVKKPYIGDAKRNIEIDDIKRANKLLYVTAFICEFICATALTVLVVITK